MAGTAEAGERDESAHHLRLEATAWFPERVPAGRALQVEIRAECNRGCDLTGGAVTILGAGGPVAEPVLAPGGAGAFETGRFVVRAPSELGSQRFNVMLRGPEGGGEAHLASENLPPFVTEAHPTSVAVWDVPSPVVTGEVVPVKIGVKCAEGCDLHGSHVEVTAASGEMLVRRELGEGIWRGSKALYWTQVEVTAPEDEGRASWEARVPPMRLRAGLLPHAPSRAAFGTMVASPPSHRLTVDVFEGSAGRPVPEAAVSFGIYRGRTDEAGRATLAVGAGTYELIVWKAGYDVPSTPLVVSADLTLRVDAERLPDTSEWEDD